MKRRPAVVLAIVAVLGVGGLTVASSLAPKRRAGTGAPVGLPTAADPSLPFQQVGVATGYAGTQLIDTGPVNYDYIGPGWAYAGILRDW